MLGITRLRLAAEARARERGGDAGALRAVRVGCTLPDRNRPMAFRLTVALPVAFLAGALFASPAGAQARGPVGLVSPGVGRSSGGARGRGRMGRRGAGRFIGGPAFLPPYYYPGEEIPQGPAPQQQPPVRVVVTQPPPPPPPAAPPVESLLLEFHDGQWIRVPTGGQLPTGPLSTQPESAPTSVAKPAVTGGNHAAQLAPPAAPTTVLVFRDGHKEEIQRYVIEGSVIYANVDYWTAGTWTKKILISELNVPATRKLNQERGVKFDLPSGPSEVVVGF
jgi:hypothetical protein